MLSKIKNTVLIFLPTILAGDGCSPGKNCVCHSDSSYYKSQECYSENSPWGGTTQRPIRALPDSPTKQKITYQCYTKSNKNSPEYLQYNQALPKHFSTSKDTIFMAHGFLSGADEKSWVLKMKDEFINNNYDYNFCAIDWSAGANVGTFNLDYPKAAQNTRVVGDVTGQLVDWLSTKKGYKNNKVHCIGHSLGAHVCGYAGKQVKNGDLKRISGMDPAGPYFENLPSYTRLDKNDASFVDSIHTDGQPIYSAGFGMLQAISDADFYPNGGHNQPGCRNLSGCSHGRSHELYIDSIAKMYCQAFPCDSEEDFNAGSCKSCGSGCQKMGWHAYDNKKKGTFNLETTDEKYWCIS